MQNGQTKPKLYIEYCESARLFIAKRIIKRNSAKIFHINNPSVTLPRATFPYTRKALGVKYK